MTHALQRRLADADLSRGIEKKVAAFIKYRLAVLRQDMTLEIAKIPTDDHGLVQSAIQEIYDEAFSEAEAVFDEAASDARAAIPSDRDIEDDWLDAVAEARHEQQAAE